MKSFLKHAGLIVGGAVCVGVAVFFPPVAPVLGPLGTKLLIAGGGTLAVALASPETIKAGVSAVTKKS